MEIGDHCSFSSCKRLDFLPFTCEKCLLIFCKDHCLPEQHSCIIVAKKVVKETKNDSDSMMCTVSGCGRVGMVEMKCDVCHQPVCLSHRHVNKHDCLPAATGSTVGTRPSSVLHKKAASSSGKPNPMKSLKDGKQSSLSKKVLLMRLKQRAEGQSSIPQSERIYFEVVLPKEYDNIEKPVFVSAEWSVGKVIDYLSIKYKLRNKNDQLNAEKLCLYRDDDCISTRLLIKDVQDIVGSCLHLCYTL